MRSPWQGNASRRGRRPDHSGPAPNEGPPYDFGAPDVDDSVDPVDLLAIRADEELLDALASGRAGYYGSRSDAELDTEFAGTDLSSADAGYRDDQQMLAMLHAWRSEVLDEPIPELVTVEQASEAIVSGHHTRNDSPRRRLMPVAAAAVVLVLGLSGVAFGAGTAMPGDALWGVSKTLDGERAASVEAAERVSVALASARAALADGRVTEAQAVLAAVGPELTKVTNEETKQELARRSANLAETAEAAEEGEQIRTDESGKRDSDSERRENSGPPGQQPSEPRPGDPKPGNPRTADPGSGGAGDKPGEGGQSGADQGPPPGQMDTRRAPGPADESAKPAPEQTTPAPQIKPAPGTRPAPETTPPPVGSTKPSPKPDKPASSPEPSPDKPKGEGEGKGKPKGEDKDKPKGEDGVTKRPSAGPLLTPPAPPPIS